MHTASLHGKSLHTPSTENINNLNITNSDMRVYTCFLIHVRDSKIYEEGLFYLEDKLEQI